VSNPKEPFEGQQYGPTYQPKGSGNEVGNVPEGLKEGDDLPATGDADENGFKGASLERLGDYLSNRVKDPQSGNYYRVVGGSNEAPNHRNVETVPDPRGAAAGGPYQATPPVVDHYGSAAVGIDKESTPGTFIDEMLSKSGEGDGMFQAQHFIRTGEGDYASAGMPTEGAPDVIAVEKILEKRAHGPGHTLYADVNKSTEDEDGATLIQQRTSAILKNNRFHPGTSSPYLRDGAWGRAGNAKGTMGTQQIELGKYNPEALAFDAEEMMKLGRALIYTATGHGKFDPNTFGLSDLAVLPNAAQLAIPLLHVETADLSARNITDHIDGEWELGGKSEYLLNTGEAGAEGQYEDTVYGDGHSNNRLTYGQLNSHLEPFAGPLPLGMVILAATSLISMLALTVLIRLAILASTNPFEVPPNTPEQENPTTLPKGKSRQPSVANFFYDILGIPITEAPLSLSMERGLAAFYGFDKALGDMTAQDIIDSAQNLATSSGYYASVMRQVVRDLEQTEKAIMNFPTGGVLSAVNGALTIITEFASSTSFRFLMQMGSLGDIIIASETYSRAPMGRDLDKIPENPGTRVGKSRAKIDSGQLVWRQSALPSRYLMPASMGIASIGWGMTKTQGADGMVAESPAIGGKIVHTDVADVNKGQVASDDKGETGNPDFTPVQNGRLSQAYVKHVEDLFELEYVPFYFHDLRTNEILGFHAFIESITDDYSPDYNTVSSYGRVDDIRIWKKTSRSMNLTFWVAATSPEDFDAMWFDINKLTTMIYPQWSRGTSLQMASGDKIVMPFSQVPMASPLIRLRLGDLVKTNYSRFNLARLFGLGQPDGLFDLSATIADLKKASEAAADNVTKAKADAIAELVSGTVKGKIDDGNGNSVTPPPPKSAEEGTAIGVLAVGNKVIVEPEISGYLFKEPAEDKKKRCTLIDTVTCTIEEIAVKGGSPVSIPGLPSPEGQPYWHVKITDEKLKKKYDPNDYGFFVPWARLVAHPDVLAEMAETEKGVTDAYAADKAAKEAYQAGGPNKFFGPDVNAIVRSFESAGGRGLAGHITSLSLGYDGAPWETRRLGSKAPMWVKVTMGFAPIHDIPPGLDADGFNRGAIYNVGRAMNALAGDDIHGENFNDASEETRQSAAQQNRADLVDPEEDEGGNAGGFGIFG